MLESLSGVSRMNTNKILAQLIEDMDLDESLNPHVKAQKLMKGPLKPYIKRLDHLVETFITG